MRGDVVCDGACEGGLGNDEGDHGGCHKMATSIIDITTPTEPEINRVHRMHS